MPLYEYQCQSCGARTEELQRFSDPPMTTCGICGGALTKLFSAPAFHLKGSGWYATDYGAKKGAKKATESGGAESGASPENSGGEKSKSAESKGAPSLEAGGAKKEKKEAAATAEKTAAKD